LSSGIEYMNQEIDNLYTVLGLDVKDPDNTKDPVTWSPVFGNGRETFDQSINQNYEYIALLTQAIGAMRVSINAIIDKIDALHELTGSDSLESYKISSLTPGN